MDLTNILSYDGKGGLTDLNSRSYIEKELNAKVKIVLESMMVKV